MRIVLTTFCKVMCFSAMHAEYPGTLFLAFMDGLLVRIASQLACSSDCFALQDANLVPKDMDALDQAMSGTGSYAPDRTMQLQLDGQEEQEKKSTVRRALQGH